MKEETTVVGPNFSLDLLKRCSDVSNRLFSSIMKGTIVENSGLAHLDVVWDACIPAGHAWEGLGRP